MFGVLQEVSAAPEPKAKNERLRGVSRAGTAAKGRGREEERRRVNRTGTAAEGRGRPVPTNRNDMTLHVEGLRRHGPGHAARRAPVVGAPNQSYGYGVVAPTHVIARVPRVWGRGIPGTRKTLVLCS